MSAARAMRAQIGDLGFKYWVRAPGRAGGPWWAGPEHGCQRNCDELMARLRALGYTPRMEGQRGTSGEWIIEFEMEVMTKFS